PAANAAVVSTPASPTSASTPNKRIFTVSSSLWSCGYLLLPPPARPVRERELGQGLRADLDAVARRRRRDVTAANDPDRVDEMLVQVVDELADTVLERGADRDVVEHRHVLRVFTQPDAACVRTDRNSELRREQDDREHFVHSSEPAAVQLASIDCAELEELLEDDAVLHVLAGRDAHRRDRRPDALVPEHVVGARRLLDPERVDLGQPPDRLDRLFDTPRLVRVEREPTVGTDRTAHEPCTAQVVLDVGPHFELQVGEALGESLTGALRQGVLRVPDPACRRRVSGKADGEEDRLALGLRRLVPAEDLERLVTRERVLDVAEVDAGHQLLRRQVDEELPQRLALELRVQIPHRIDDGRGGEVDDALLRPEPAKLGVGDEPAPQSSAVCD